MAPQEVMRSSRAVVTGCAGFIGSHLAESLLRDGVQVVGIDCFNDNYGRPQKLQNLRHLTDWELFEFIPIDLSRGDLDGVVEGSDVVYHLAAEPGVRSSWGERYEQYLRNNVLATQHLLESLRRLNTARLVYASSSSVYGDADVQPTPEDHRLRPRSPYGQTKAAMEHLCELYNANFGVDVVGLRYFTVYGPRQRPDMAFNRICRAALQNETFAVYGTGRQTRDFTYVADAVAATRAAAETVLGSHRLFNIGGGSPAALCDVLDLVSELLDRPLQLSFSDTEHGDVADTSADTSRAQSELGFEPSVSLREGVAAELSWLQADELVG